ARDVVLRMDAGVGRLECDAKSIDVLAAGAEAGEQILVGDAVAFEESGLVGVQVTVDPATGHVLPLIERCRGGDQPCFKHFQSERQGPPPPSTVRGAHVWGPQSAGPGYEG